MENNEIMTNEEVMETTEEFNSSAAFFSLSISDLKYLPDTAS